MSRRAVTALAAALVVGLLAAVAVAGGASAGDGDGRRLHANLKGENEVPGPGAPGGASGFARVEVKPGHGTVCFNLRWEEISPPTAAHIHFGTADVAGPIVVGLFMSSESPDQPPTLPDTITGVKGCSHHVTIPPDAPFDSAKDLLRNIVANPHEYYVNVHTLDFPGGAIRGQLKTSH
jgi:CHRD domain